MTSYNACILPNGLGGMCVSQDVWGLYATPQATVGTAIIPVKRR